MAENCPISYVFIYFFFDCFGFLYETQVAIYVSEFTKKNKNVHLLSSTLHLVAEEPSQTFLGIIEIYNDLIWFLIILEKGQNRCDWSQQNPTFRCYANLPKHDFKEGNATHVSREIKNIKPLFRMYSIRKRAEYSHR